MAPMNSNSSLTYCQHETDNIVSPITSVPLKTVSEKEVDVQQAVMVGAGVAGLIGALVLAQEGFQVVVLEKRSSCFDRWQPVNLKLESESIFEDLGILESFRTEVATRLESHTYFKYESGRYVQFDYEDTSNLHTPCRPEFAVESLPEQFQQGAAYTTPIGDLQRFLAHHASRSPNISFVTDVDAVLCGHDTKVLTVSQQSFETEFRPNLIVLSDGGGRNRCYAEELMDEEIESNHPCQGERWIIANVSYPHSEKSFVNVLSKKIADDFVQIANVTFDGRRGLANVAVTTPSDGALTDAEIRTKLAEVAQEAFALNGLPHDRIDMRTVCGPVAITNRICPRFTLGRNAVVAGDRAGTSSPLAGMGATLAVTCYACGIRRVARVVKSGSEEEVRRALREYEDLARASVHKWWDNARRAKEALLAQMVPPRRTRLG